MMRIFYVRPKSPAGYGNGDGSSYENAWNGFDAVDWGALSKNDPPATLWVCGAPDGPQGFLTVHVEWSFLNLHPENELAKARTLPRRESPQPV